MSAVVLRLLIYGGIGLAIYFGLRSILRDWRERFRELDRARKKRDQNEAKRPGVVELERDKDGVFRPKSDRGKDKGGSAQ